MTFRVPPRWLRRLLLAPIVVVGAFWVLTTLPLLVIGAAVVSPFLPGKWRALRLLGFALVYLAMELVGLVAALALWVASGFGYAIRSERFVSLHYGLLRWALRVLVTSAEQLFTLEVVEEPGYEIAPIAQHPGPLIVLSRHAGPGDSFLLAHEILSVAGRRPRIVLKDVLQLDPLIDVLLNRLPSRFISSRPGAGDEATTAIAQLAADMGPRDALLIFPEGGNFTERRRLRAIARLRHRGHDGAASRAESLKYVLPPRPGGAFAALDASPDASVVLVAHTGLDDLDTVAELWATIPQDNTLRVSWLGVARAELPPEPDRAAWLQERWQDIDGWISRHRPPERT